MFGPVLRGERVTLRPVREDDAALFVAWLADTEVTRFTTTRFPPTIELEHEWLKRAGESADEVVWAIEADGRAIGTSGIHRIDWIHGHGVTGTLIGDKAAWRRGYGSEAMRLRTEYAFLQLNLHKLVAEAFVENEGSARAQEKAGYRPVGVRREHLWREGRWHDLRVSEILRSDWERLR